MTRLSRLRSLPLFKLGEDGVFASARRALSQSLFKFGEDGFLASTRRALSGISAMKIFIVLVAFGFIATILIYLPLDQFLKDFLLWLKNDVGPWGPLIMALAYIPLTVLALPGSILTLGGGYAFGLLVGFAADSIGSTMGATAAFLVGKTIGRSYVSAKLKEYPKFQVVATAISKSGFKIVLLLRLVPILPCNVMNYVLSVTPIGVGSYVLASWIGMMPCTFAFVYIGTTIKDISEIGTKEASMAAFQWWMLGIGLVCTVVVTLIITRVAKDALQKAIEEHEHSEGPACEEGKLRLQRSGVVLDMESPRPGKASGDVRLPLAHRVDSSPMPSPKI